MALVIVATGFILVPWRDVYAKWAHHIAECEYIGVKI